MMNSSKFVRLATAEMSPRVSEPSTHTEVTLFFPSRKFRLLTGVPSRISTRTS